MASVNYTYLYFITRDYSGSNTLSSYSLQNTPITFIPDFTSSPLLTGANVLSNRKIEWHFGDGSYSNTLTAVHQYKFPGTYRPKLTIYDNYGNAYDSSYQPTITIYDFVADKLGFKEFKRFIYDVPASKIIEPITIQRQNSWQSYRALSAEGYTINLYASGAAGDYINYDSFLRDKWSHLRSLSRLYEIQQIGDFEEFVIVDKVLTKDTKIFANIVNNSIQQCGENDTGSIFAGTTGYAEFYYVDDRTKNYTTREPPILIFATFDSAKFKDEYSVNNDIQDYVGYPPYGFQALDPAVLPIIKVRHNSAGRLSITSNGIDGEGALSATNFNIPEISWQYTEIPFVIRMKDFENYTTKTYPPLSSSTIETLAPNVTAYNLEISLVKQNNDSSRTCISAVNFYSDFTADIPRTIGGFYKGYFIPQISSESLILTAGMTVVDPVNFPKDSLVGWVSMPQYYKIKRIFKTRNFNYCDGTMEEFLSAYVTDYDTPGSVESYAFQVAPSGAAAGEDYRTWVADGNADKIYKITLFGEILSAFSLSSYPFSGYSSTYYVDLRSSELSSAAPASIVMDGNSDAWFTLFDAVSSIKIDYYTGHAKAVAYPNYQNFVYALSSDYNIAELSGFAGENLILPSSVDTDPDNNIWVAYTHPVSNFIVKYNDVGTLLFVIPLPSLISPVEICIDRNSYAWVTTLNMNYPVSPSVSLTAKNDFVYKFDKYGNTVPGYPLTGFRLAGNITVDGAQNAYVVNDRETVIKLDANNPIKTTYYPGGSGINQTNYICSIGGIACDTANYLWIINNFENQLYFVDTTNTSISSIAGSDSIALEFPQDTPTNPVTAFTERIFQAYGDWIGSRWINKYMVPFNVTRYLSGESALFNVYPSTGQYNITKINENFNAQNFYKDLRYQEILFDQNIFFDQFLGTIVGGISAQPYELGKVVYEKIANFVSNNSDADKCNVNQLLSFCEELSLQFEEYNYPFPPQIRRLVDILSIKHKLLWGERNTFNENFDKKGYINSTKYGINLNNQIDAFSGTITSGSPIVALELFSNLFTIVNKTNILGYALSSVLPLSTYSYDWGWGLVAPKSLSGTDIMNYYAFYEYNNITENSFYNNTLNWNDPINLLSPTLSSYSDWSKNNGIMQNILSYEMTKGLKLFTSAVDIVYNN
jgi:hypothetical protein